MDIRDFISGTQVQKDEFASRVMSASILFATDLIIVIDRWINDLPEGMKADLSESVNNYYGIVSEFVDVDAIMEHAAQSEEDE